MVLQERLRFFQSPDLLTELLSFLDVSSSLALAKVLPLAADLLQRKFIWQGLMRKIILENYFENRLEEGDEEKDADEDEDVEEEDKEERWKETNKTGAVQLVAILKTVEDPEPLLLELFDTLCRFFAQYWDIESHVAMSCPCHPDPEDWHCVNAEGFQLLELVEGMMGTSLQQIRGIEITSVDDDCDDDFRKALAARLARQTETIEEVKLQDATFWRYNELNATILEKAKTWDVHDVSLEYFGGRIGPGLQSTCNKARKSSTI